MGNPGISGFLTHQTGLSEHDDFGDSSTERRGPLKGFESLFNFFVLMQFGYFDVCGAEVVPYFWHSDGRHAIVPLEFQCILLARSPVLGSRWIFHVRQAYSCYLLGCKRMGIICHVTYIVCSQCCYVALLTMSCHVVSCCVVSCRVVLCCIVLRHVASCCLTTLWAKQHRKPAARSPLPFGDWHVRTHL